jgi:hypothetical protein
MHRISPEARMFPDKLDIGGRLRAADGFTAVDLGHAVDLGAYCAPDRPQNPDRPRAGTPVGELPVSMVAGLGVAGTDSEVLWVDHC